MSRIAAADPIDALSRSASWAPGRVLITAATEQHLRAELERRRHELEVVFAARIRDARSTGDGSSGDDHLQIREEEAVVRSEVARIEARLASAVIVEEQDSTDGTAGIGSVVEIRDLDSGAVYSRLITGDFDSTSAARAAANPVSASSPVGRALLGSGPGEEVRVELPNGRVRRLEVTAVTAGVVAAPG